MVLENILRRCAKPAFTTRKNSFSSMTSTGGLSRNTQRMTELVTAGAGKKDLGGTSRTISGSV